MITRRSLSKEMNIHIRWINIMLLNPVITYSTETRPLRKTKETKLIVLKRKIFANFFIELVQDVETGEWKLKSIYEL